MLNDFSLVLIFAFIGGIMVASILQPSLNTQPYIVGGLILFSCSSFYIYFFRDKRFFKVIFTITIFLASFVYLQARSDLGKQYTVGDYASDKNLLIEGIISSPVKRDDRGGVKFELSKCVVTRAGVKFVTTGNIQVIARKISHALEYGDLIEFQARLRIPTNSKNPGAFDYISYLKRRGIYALASIYKDDKIVSLTKSHKTGMMYYVNRLRKRTNDFIYSRGKSINKYIISALLFGNSRQINKSAHDLFVKTGTSHILAISGLHMGVISLFIYYLSIFFLKRGEKFTLKHNIIKIAYSITFFSLIFYSLLVGMRVSSIRAVIMIGVYILALLFDRAQNTLRTMFVAAFFILLAFPGSLRDVSFLLSFTAVFAILYFYPKIGSRIDSYFELSSSNYFRKRSLLQSVLKSIIVVFVLSCVINLLILPIIMYNFNYVTLTSPLINAITIPIYSLFVIPMNFVIFFFSLFYPAVGEFFLHLNEDVIRWTYYTLKFLNEHINYSFYTVTPTPLEIALYFLLVYSIFKARERTFRISAVICALLLLASGYYYNVKPYSDKNILTVDFIDVGQGESSLITFPNGKRMLIDGGGSRWKSRFDVGRDVVAKYLWKRRINKVDYILSTHPHPDHINGLFFIAENFSPEKIFIGKYDYDKKIYKNFLRKNSEKIEYLGSMNSKLEIGGAKITILKYDQSGVRSRSIDVNRSSIIVIVEQSGKKILFTGDTDSVIEARLIAKGEELDCDVLKVAHHGSRTSTSDGFLEVASPKYAVISVGENNYFHLPAEETVARLVENGVKIYRTDRDGLITLKVSDGEMSFSTMVP